jgi:hypothetical protein
VRRAILVGKAIHFKRAKAAALAETLDGLSAGMFLVGGRGHIIHANVAGRLILGADDFLRSIRGQLVAGDAQVNQTLREIFAIAEQGNAALGVKGIALPLTAHDGARYVAHVLPLTSGARRGAGITYTATAAVFVRKAALRLAGVRRSRPLSALQRLPSRRMSVACLKKPVPAARPIWSNWLPAFRRRWQSDPEIARGSQ